MDPVVESITSGTATYACRTHVVRSKTGMVVVAAKTKGPIDTGVEGNGLYVLHLPTGGQRTDARVCREAIFSCYSHETRFTRNSK